MVAEGANLLHGPPMNSAWKPIDLAPRDGRKIVIAFRSPISDDVSVAASCWRDGGWEGDDIQGDPETFAGLVPFAWTEMPR